MIKASIKQKKARIEQERRGRAVPEVLSFFLSQTERMKP